MGPSPPGFVVVAADQAPAFNTASKIVRELALRSSLLFTVPVNENECAAWSPWT